MGDRGQISANIGLIERTFSYFGPVDVARHNKSEDDTLVECRKLVVSMGPALCRCAAGGRQL